MGRHLFIKGVCPKKNQPPRKFACELRATDVKSGSLVACCVLADLNEWVVLNESVVSVPMADEHSS